MHSSGPSPGFSSRGAKNQKGGHILKIHYWIHVATGGPNVKWGAPISNGVAGHHWPPRWRRPWAQLRINDINEILMEKIPSNQGSTRFNFRGTFSSKPKGNFSSFQWTSVAWATEITRNNGSLCSNNGGLCSNNGRLSSSNCRLISTSSSRLRTVYTVEKRQVVQENR